jgi:RNA polymerase sigma factor for flagellar operon FliA
MKTSDELIADCQGLVRSLAWQIHCKLPTHVDLEDLVGYGQIGLIEAARAFDPTRENQFSTYCYHRIRGAIFDGLSKMNWFNQASFNSGAYERQRQPAKPKPQPPAEPVKTPDQLIADCQGLVRTLAWQIRCKLPQEVELLELTEYGQKGLAEAARGFAASRASQFSTYCYRIIQEAIFEGLSRKPWFNRADYHRGVYGLVSLPPVEPVVSDPVVESEPSDESAEHGARGTAGLVSVICGGFASGDASGVEQDDESQQTPLEVAMQREMIEKLTELIESLPDSQRVLIQATYFEGLTLKDAGERLGMSKAWASRLHAKTLDQLAQSFRLSQMSD